MADRFPLIVDSTTQTIKELPSGDNLDLTGSSIVNASSIDVTGTVTTTGNVGIGTATPSEVLNVKTSSGNSYVDVERATQAQGEVGLKISGGTSGADWFVYQPASSNDLRFYKTGDKVTIDSSGNVGIGITPIPDGSGYSGGTLHIHQPSTAASTGASLRLTNATNGTTVSTKGFYLSQFNDTNTYFVNQEGGQVFYTAGTERMRIDSSGNVGIGQDTPKTTLNLGANNSGQGAILTLENTDTSITTDDVIGQIDFYANDGSTNGTGAKVNIKAIATSTAGTLTALTFGTSNSTSATAVEAMRIDSSGNVGIGTSSPSTVLGATSLEVSNATGSEVIVFRDDGSTEADDFCGGFAIGNRDASGTPNHYAGMWANTDTFGQMTLKFAGGRSKYEAGTPDMVIDIDGNVGIGTSSPASELHVKSSGISSDTLTIENSTGNGSWRVKEGGSSNALLQGYNASNSETIRLDPTSDTFFNGGNVGIGDSNPLSILHIGGGSDANVPVTFAPSTGGNAEFRNTSSTGTFTFTNNNGSSEAMRIDASGNLLVGKTAPNSATAGVQILPEGDVGITRNGSHSLLLNRLTSDGDIALFRKDGASVGSIGTEGGDLTIGTGDTGLKFNNGLDQIYAWDTLTNSVRDGLTDLGASTARFKDLYLSGFVSGGSSTGLTTRAVVSGGVTALKLQQARGSIASPTVSASGGDGNYIQSEVYDGSAFNSIAYIGMVTGTSLDDGDIVFGTAKAGSTTVKMTLDEDGNLLVGTTTVPSQTTGVSTGVYFVVKGDIIPSVDAGFSGHSDLGDPSTRYEDAYVRDGVTIGSDGNDKQDIEALSDAEQRVAVACKGLLRKWRWKDAVEEKGGEARIHFGIIAQDLQAAFEAEGLDAGRYAMFMSNTWTDEETGEERARLGVRYHELLAFIIAAI